MAASSRRWKLWPIARAAHRLIQAYTKTGLHLYLIDATGAFLGTDGRPYHPLFRRDRLHPNACGYEKWTTLIKPVLLADLFHH